MKDPKLEVEIRHSESKTAWNVIGTGLGGRYKIAKVPYDIINGNEVLTTADRVEALNIAKFIAYCLNNSEEIIDKV